MWLFIVEKYCPRSYLLPKRYFFAQVMSEKERIAFFGFRRKVARECTAEGSWCARFGLRKGRRRRLCFLNKFRC